LLPRGFQGDVGKIGSIERSIASTFFPPAPTFSGSVNDPDIAALFAERQARLSLLRGEGPRMLRAGNWRRAGELCRAWSELEFWNPEPWRCLGFALQAQGYHQEAIGAFRRAAQYDPLDKSLDSAIEKSQRGIVADFINRYRR
jgi:tetratricopeptide (TPR) repeat protein